MSRSRLLFVIILCCLAAHVHPAFGCRYNVREVGFIDVGIEAYRLYVCLPENTPADEVASLKETADIALGDSNIRFEPVVVRADTNHPAMEFLTVHGISQSPAAVLVSPDGQSIPLTLAGGALKQAVSTLIEYVLRSPARQEIFEKTAANYGVVLLIDGPDQQRNTTAREVISTAVGRIGEQLEFLPKPIGKPPVLVTLDRQSLAREGVLLWALGVRPQDVNEPLAAVLYGRGRWIGPLFRGAMFTADHLTELLSIIGADCECGLDHRFLQGTMLPARWDEDLHQKVVESLGFDPEDPMVKMEMVSIVRRGMGGFDGVDMPLGYREIQIGGDAPQDTGPMAVTNNDSSVPSRAQSAIRNPQSEGGRWEFRILAASLGGMAVLVALASVVVILRARKV